MTQVTEAPDGWAPMGGDVRQPELQAPPSSVDGLTGEENGLLAGLSDVWTRHRARNRTLTEYYEAKQPLRWPGDMKVPDSIKRQYTPVGWARKAVDMLAELCVFEGFVSPKASDPWNLTATLQRIGFGGILQQAIQTALIHGCSFLATLRDAQGRPVVRTHTAESAAALWNYPERRVEACMAVTDMDRHDNVTGLVLYLPDRTVGVRRVDGVWTLTGWQPSIDGTCGVQRLAYKPTETKPFGRSRISRDAMRCIDAADRMLVCVDANELFYSWPKIFILGASDDLAAMSPDDALRAYMGRMQIITKDSDGDSPQVVQLASSGADSTIQAFKMLASMFASSMNIPASSLGVVADSNPTSAEATDAQREDLIIEAQRCARDFGQSLLGMARLVVRAADPSVSDSDLDQLQADWRNPNTPSASMSADAFTKLASAIPGFADSDVGWARAGLSRGEIIRLRARRTQTESDSALLRLLSDDAQQGTGTEATAGDDDGPGEEAGGEPGQGGAAVAQGD